MATFAGQIILSVNGLPVIHLKSLDWTVQTNRETVVGMSPTGRAAGVVGGTHEYTLSADVYIPRTGDIPWESIEGAVITGMPRDGGAGFMFTGVATTKVGASFQEKGAAVRKIEFVALTKLEV